MNARKIIIIVLMLIAIPVYGWNIYLVIIAAAGSAGSRLDLSPSTKLKAPSLLGVVAAVAFVPQGKSPFVAYIEKPKPVAPAKNVKSNVVKSKEQKPQTPPPVTINGIMWNPSNPVVILNNPDGSTELTKKGQKLANGITVLDIEKSRIKVLWQDKQIWIGK